MISTTPGRRLFDPAETVGLLAAGQGFQATGPLTALAGGGRPNATQLVYGMNTIGTVATGNDSAVLPAAMPGTFVMAANLAANSAQIFARGSDTINATAGSIGVALATTKNAMFFCAVKGNWRMILSA